MEAAGLADTLAGEGPFTVFAPTNDALAKVGCSFVIREGQIVLQLPAELVEVLTTDTELLKQVTDTDINPVS